MLLHNIFEASITIIICIVYTVGPLYYKPLIMKCGNLYDKDTILCPSVVL